MNKHLLEMYPDIQTEVLKLREEGQNVGGSATKIYAYISRMEDINTALEDKLTRRNRQIKTLKKRVEELEYRCESTEDELREAKEDINR